MKFLAQLQEMAASEIMNIVPPEIYEEIKAKDPTPQFRAYVVGHEGESAGKMVGSGTVIRNWFSSAIKKLSEKIQYGTKLFHGHAQTNEHEGRIPIGEIVGKAIRTIKEKVSAIAVTYIYPEYRNLPLDVASIEADVNIDPSRDSIEAVDVGGVTGIALGNSAVEKPGFAGATLLSQIQAFANGHSQINVGGGNMTTLSEVKDFIKGEGLSPSEVFGRDSLIDDPIVKGYISETNKIATAGEYAHRKRTDEKFTEEKAEWEKAKAEFETKIKGLKTESAKVKAADLFSTKAKERKLDDKQAKFIKQKQEGFTPEDADALEKEVDGFMDKVLEEYKATAKIFGEKTDPKAEPKGGGEPGDGGSDDNEFIPD